MDASTIIGLFVSVIVATGGAVASTYALILRREKVVWDAIEKLREELKEIRTNYIDKFATVNQNIASTELKLTQTINEVEKNLRESNHALNDGVQKALARIELIVAGRNDTKN